MTDDELTAIEQRVQAATPGPWESYPYWHRKEGEPPACDLKMEGALVTFEQPFREVDAAFIAHAREDVPALLAEVRRLQEILTAIIYASDGCVGHKDCNHSIKPWKDARAHLGLLRDGEVVPER